MEESRRLIVALPLRRLNRADKMAYEGQHGNETREERAMTTKGLANFNTLRTHEGALILTAEERNRQLQLTD
jgi:hypothetical protein